MSRIWRGAAPARRRARACEDPEQPGRRPFPWRPWARARRGRHRRLRRPLATAVTRAPGTGEILIDEQPDVGIVLGQEHVGFENDSRRGSGGGRRRDGKHARSRETGKGGSPAAERGRGLDGKQKREGAAHAGKAPHAEQAAESHGKLARDRQPQAKTADAADVAGVNLKEGFKDTFDMLVAEPDAGVGDVEADGRRSVELGMKQENREPDGATGCGT